MDTLTQLVYCSRHKGNISEEDTALIADLAENRNKQLYISGCLISENQCFLQCLEGSRRSLNLVLESIYNDPRHEQITILYSCEIAQRIFPEWKMHHIQARNLWQVVLGRFSSHPEFNPYNMSEISIKALLQEIARKYIF